MQDGFIFFISFLISFSSLDFLIDILKLLIEKSSKQIGIQILDKKDLRGRTPFLYSIIFNNIDCYIIIANT